MASSKQFDGDSAVLYGGHPYALHPGESIGSLMIRAAEEMEPELFRRLYPRVYRELGAYYSPKMIAAFLTDVIASSRSLPMHMVSMAHRLMLPGLRPLMDKRMPVMFIAPDLIEAIKHTDFPHEINWKEIKLPYEHGLFVLPKGAL